MYYYKLKYDYSDRKNSKEKDVKLSLLLATKYSHDHPMISGDSVYGQAFDLINMIYEAVFLQSSTVEKNRDKMNF